MSVTGNASNWNKQNGCEYLVTMQTHTAGYPPVHVEQVQISSLHPSVPQPNSLTQTVTEWHAEMRVPCCSQVQSLEPWEQTACNAIT